MEMLQHWGIPLKVQEASDPPRTRALGITLFMKVKYQGSTVLNVGCHLVSMDFTAEEEDCIKPAGHGSKHL